MKRDEPLEPRPITVRAPRAAALLGVSQRMVEQLARDGAISSFKVAGRVRLFRVAGLEAWAERTSEAASKSHPPGTAADRVSAGGAP